MQADCISFAQNQMQSRFLQFEANGGEINWITWVKYKLWDWLHALQFVCMWNCMCVFLTRCRMTKRLPLILNQNIGTAKYKKLKKRMPFWHFIWFTFYCCCSYCVYYYFTNVCYSIWTLNATCYSDNIYIYIYFFCFYFFFLCGAFPPINVVYWAFKLQHQALKITQMYPLVYTFKDALFYMKENMHFFFCFYNNFFLS